jgi:hypothetical protein
MTALTGGRCPALTPVNATPLATGPKSASIENREELGTEFALIVAGQSKRGRLAGL